MLSYYLYDVASTDSIALEDENVIGRNIGNIIVKHDTSLSSKHCSISHNGDFIEIVDFGSKNGTKVNGIMLSPNIPKKLRSGDRIEVGKQSYVFTEGLVTQNSEGEHIPEVQEETQVGMDFKIEQVQNGHKALCREIDLIKDALINVDVDGEKFMDWFLKKKALFIGVLDGKDYSAGALEALRQNLIEFSDLGLKEYRRVIAKLKVSMEKNLDSELTRLESLEEELNRLKE